MNSQQRCTTLYLYRIVYTYTITNKKPYNIRKSSGVPSVKRYRRGLFVYSVQ